MSEPDDNFIPKPRKPRKIREKDVEADHVDGIKEAGGLSLKFTSPARRSVPDRLDLLGVERLREALAAQGVYLSQQTCIDVLAAAIAFTECKAPKKKPTPAQLEEHERLRALGFTVNVVDNLRPKGAPMAELNTTQINERLGGVKVTGELIAELGIAPTRREKRAMYWDESKFADICNAVALYVTTRSRHAPTPAAPCDDLFGE